MFKVNNKDTRTTPTVCFHSARFGQNEYLTTKKRQPDEF